MQEVLQKYDDILTYLPSYTVRKKQDNSANSKL